MKVLNIEQYNNMINEKLITFNGKAYPKYNQIVIVCGGGGSGKGFVVKNVLGIDAKVLNVDDIKDILVKMKSDGELSKKFEDKYGKPLDKVDMTVPKDVSDLHEFVGDNRYAERIHDLVFQQQVGKKDKDNILFDVTLKNYPKVEDIARLAGIGGYDINNIHLVWVLNNFDTAVKQNNGRARKVDPSILKKTHIGCANQMHRILRYSDGHNLVGGDVWIYFGSTNTGDAKMANSSNGGKYITDFCAVKCKSAGKDFEDYDELMSKKVKLYDKDGKEVGEVTLKDKINKYIPLESERF